MSTSRLVRQARKKDRERRLNRCMTAAVVAGGVITWLIARADPREHGAALAVGGAAITCVIGLTLFAATSVAAARRRRRFDEGPMLRRTVRRYGDPESW